MTIDFEAAANEHAAIPATTEQLRAVSDLAQQLLNLEDQLEADQASVAATQATLKKVQCELLPAAMKAISMAKFTLTNGSVVSVEDEVYASITEANAAAAFAWLEASGNGAIIKNLFAVTVAKGDVAAAQKLQKLLTDNGYGEFDIRTTVHAGTLKAFVRAELARESGTTLPKETFSVFEQTVAKIKVPKPKGKGKK